MVQTSNKRGYVQKLSSPSGAKTKNRNRPVFNGLRTSVEIEVIHE